jgi:hypothetical protein
MNKLHGPKSRDLKTYLFLKQGNTVVPICQVDHHRHFVQFGQIARLKEFLNVQVFLGEVEGLLNVASL